VRQTSPAVDLAPPFAENELGLQRTFALADLDGKSRQVDLVGINDAANTPRDAGAYERQSLVVVTFPDDENFDEIDDNALPPGWTSIATGASNGWVITGTNQDSNSVFAAHTDDPGAVSNSMLNTPPFSIAQWGRLSFRQAFQLEDNYDAAVLEIRIGTGPYQDILLAGGHFSGGGYNGALLQGAMRNPIEAEHPGRMAWTGDNGMLTYQDVVVDLPAAANGKSVQLRWRVGSDGNGTHAGYWLDSVHVDRNRATPPNEIFGNGFQQIP
jgi:hypothetical protein